MTDNPRFPVGQVIAFHKQEAESWKQRAETAEHRLSEVLTATREISRRHDLWVSSNEAGQRARYDGKLEADNPFPLEDITQHGGWQRGWEEMDHLIRAQERDALKARLAEAEAVLEQYAESDNWTSTVTYIAEDYRSVNADGCPDSYEADVEIDGPHCWTPGDNGAELALKYFEKYDQKEPANDES